MKSTLKGFRVARTYGDVRRAAEIIRHLQWFDIEAWLHAPVRPEAPHTLAMTNRQSGQELAEVHVRQEDLIEASIVMDYFEMLPDHFAQEKKRLRKAPDDAE